MEVGGHLALSLHSSNEPGELSQWPRRDDSTVNIVIGIIVIRPHRSTVLCTQMRPTVTDEVAWFVGLLVCHDREAFKNG